MLVNLRHLSDQNLVLKGELPAGELDVDTRDEVIHVEQPLHYELEAQKLDQSLLLRGRLSLRLNCQCVRCLKPFAQGLEIAPWTCHVSLTGEERAPVVNDCVDLTPHIREDILLEFPQHPLCNPECPGLKKTDAGEQKRHPGQTSSESSAWAELDKLKL